MKYENGIETKNMILSVSKQLFFDNGFKETSIRTIAKEANISSGTIYKHFENKEAILDEILLPHIDKLWDIFESILKDFEQRLEKSKTKEDIRALVMNESYEITYNYMKKNPEIWYFIFFNSKGTKYDMFFYKVVDWEVKKTLMMLEKIDKEKRYLSMVSDVEIYFLVEGFFRMVLNAFDKRMDDNTIRNYFDILSNLYKPFWEKVFVMQF